MSKIALIFSGQGAQYAGMGKDLYENIEECREIFDIADRELGFSIKKICFDGEEGKIDKTEYTQPAILTTSIAALRAFEKEGIEYHAVAGLSLGEYSALVSSGMISFEECVTLVRKRGLFMEEAVKDIDGTLAAIIGLDIEQVEELVNNAKKEDVLQISNLNCPKQIVIGGETAAIDRAVEIAKEMGAKRALKLNVSGPFHTKLLKEAAENLYTEMNNIEFKENSLPIYMNVNGEKLNSGDDIKEIMKLQVMSSVYWEKSIRNMIDDGIDTFIEIGPGKVLSGFVKKVDRKLNCMNIEDLKTLENTLSKLRGE